MRSIVRRFGAFLLAAVFPLLYAQDIFAEELPAEDWIRTAYNEDNGLPTGEANVVTQTSDGYIWIGSYGGLIRYDGTEFRNYSEEESGLESSSIRSLYEAKDGRFYIGTNDMGVYLYQENAFTRLSAKEGAFYSVRSFTETADGTVYVGTTSGLAKISGSDPSALEPVEDTVGHIIYDLACDAGGTVWGCSDNGEVLLVKDGQVRIENSDAWMESDCYSVLAASDGSLYLGSSGNELVQLSVQPDGSAKVLRTLETGSLHTANKLYEDGEQNIWVLADNGIGCLKPDGTFQIPAEMESMTSVGSMVQDYEGNLWAASTRTGIVYFSHGKYANFNHLSELEGVTVNTVVRCGEYSYIGTDEGLRILDESCLPVENSLTEELAGKRVRHITAARDGSLWFSLYGDGLVHYIPEKEESRLFSQEDGLLSNQVRMTLEMQDGAIAVAQSSGIDILQGGKVVRSYGQEELPYPFILCMVQAEDGSLVAGSDGMGIYVIRDSQVTQYYQKEGLDSGVVMRMAEDPAAGGVWVSAGNALYFWDAGGIRKLPFQDGVGSVLDIQVIGDEIWLMKSNGPVHVKREMLLTGEGEVERLTKKYGLTGTLVANSWNFLGEDGKLWLCTNNGISVIDTHHIPQNTAPPRGAVTQIRVDDTVWASPQQITVPASARRITLDLAVMSYTLADKSVEYYLEGFDQGVSRGKISELSSISYTNLDGGDYVFHMTVYNEDGVQGDSVTVAIHKEYHFWELRWVQALFVLGLIAVIAAVFQIAYRFKIRALKKRQTEYRSIIEQALHTFANAIDAKDKDTNGHSLRVAAYSKELARRMKLSPEEQENIYYMALLHDIGKIGIPDSILKKQGKLTDEEWKIVKSHPEIGGEILKTFTAIPGIADGARYHHEFYNGKGYCEGLKGEEIPLMARIIAVADAFDAMCSKRYYHEGSTVAHARGEIERCSGEQFDPDVAKHMLDMIDEGFMDQKA